MPAIVACPKCKAKFKLPDHLLGKSLKCKQCGTAIPATSGKPDARAAVGVSRRVPSGAPDPTGRASTSPDELAKLGLDGPLRRAPDLFAGAGGLPPRGPDILGNAAADPGFAASMGEFPEASAETPAKPKPKPGPATAEFLQNPALPPARAARHAGGSDNKVVKKAKRKPKKLPLIQQPWLIILTVFPALTLLVLIIGLFVPEVLAVGLFVVLGLLCLTSGICSIWLLMEACQSADNSTELILYFFVPFYAIFFFVKHWDTMWKSVSATLALTASFILFFVLCAAFALSGVEMPERFQSKKREKLSATTCVEHRSYRRFV